jgi:ABC-2 type transport system permease protein
MKSLSRLSAVMRKEVRQMRRDRLTFAMIFGIPLIQLLLFGYAINTDVRNLTSAVADEAGTHLSREFVARLSATQVTNIQYRVDTAADLERMLRSGEISLGVAIPPDFDRRVSDDRRAAIHILVDGSDPTIAGIADQLRNMPIAFDTAAKDREQALIEVRPYYNPERRTPINIIPGLIGVILTMTMLMFTAVAVVRERERGNLELLINTPVTSAELMVGKVVPYIAIGLVQLAVILVPCCGAVHRGKPGAGPVCFDRGQDAVPGHADDILPDSAFDSAIRVRVPFRRHASHRTAHWRGPADHPFHPPDPRCHAA